MKPTSVMIIAVIWLATGQQPVGAAEEPKEENLGTLLEELLPGMGAEEMEARKDPQQRWQEICFRLGAPGNEARRAEACRLMAGKLGPDTPAQARIWLLKQLERIGRGECVGAVAALLDDKDPKVRDAARRAMANNPAPEAGARLQEALQAARDNDVKVSLINALGFRAEEASLPAIASELGNPEAKVVAAAARALGKLPTQKAARALAAAREDARGNLRLLITDAYLRCADAMLANGQTRAAAATYRELYKPDEPTRLAALVGMLKTTGDGAGMIILGILAGGDREAQGVAVGQIKEITGGAVKALSSGLGKLPPSGQVTLLAALAVRGDRASLPAVLAAVENPDEKIKLAALRALGGVGDASVVPLLWERLRAEGDAGGAARASIESLSAPGVDEKLIDMVQGAGDSEDRALLIEILDRRRAVAAVPALLKEALHDDAGVRRRAMGALGRLAGPEQVEGMVRAMMKAGDGGERSAAEDAITAVCQRIPDEERRAEQVLALYNELSEAEQNGLLPLLGRIGGTEARKVIRGALASSDAERHDAGVRAICNWPDGTVAEDLLKVAESARADAQRTRALQALARVLFLPGAPSDPQAVALLKKAMELAARRDERNLFIERAGRISHIDSLRFVAPYLEDEELAQRACRTVVELARNDRLRRRNRAEFDKALQEVVEVSSDRRVVERAKEYTSGR